MKGKLIRNLFYNRHIVEEVKTQTSDCQIAFPIFSFKAFYQRLSQSYEAVW